jgi:hypothetical protein
MQIAEELMKIKVALIPSEHRCKAQNLSFKLQSAIETGEMKVVDEITEKLLSLTDKNYSQSLSEEFWHQLIEKIRSYNGNFKSDYLMTKPQLEMIITAGVAESYADVTRVVEQALKTDSAVLQLPFEEEDDYV